MLEEKDKNVDLISEDQIIDSGDKLLKNALREYIEYLNKRNKSNDNDKKTLQKKCIESCEKVQELRESYKKLQEEADKSYEKCKFYFQRVTEMYERAEQQGYKNIYRHWGDCAYAQAIVNKREAFYKNAKSFFEKAKDNYTKIEKKTMLCGAD